MKRWIQLLEFQWKKLAVNLAGFMDAGISSSEAQFSEVCVSGVHVANLDHQGLCVSVRQVSGRYKDQRNFPDADQFFTSTEFSRLATRHMTRDLWTFQDSLVMGANHDNFHLQIPVQGV